MTKPPILFLIYNRPEITEITFSVIRRYRPNNLFIAADGPNENSKEDTMNCQLARRSTEKIDWDCKVQRLYRNSHVGLRGAVYEAVSWFFKNVENGIILEDDCLADQSFFRFCEQMLNKYSNDKKIIHIGGSNFLPVSMHRKNGYYFSKYANVWGWATWRDRWGEFDYSLKKLRNFVLSDKYKRLHPNLWERAYWIVLSNALLGGTANSWAYRWLFSIWEHDGLSISPGVNLVENIGLTKAGTHINTNIKGLKIKPGVIDSKPILLSSRYSAKADESASRLEYRISPIMVFAQWGYFLLKGIKVKK